MSWARDGRGSRSIILAVEVVLSSLDLPNARLSQVNESLLLERETKQTSYKSVTQALHCFGDNRGGSDGKKSRALFCF